MQGKSSLSLYFFSYVLEMSDKKGLVLSLAGMTEKGVLFKFRHSRSH